MGIKFVLLSGGGSLHTVGMFPPPYQRDVRLAVFLCFFFAVLILILTFKLILVGQAKIHTYEDCSKASDSKILESYPAICISADGRRFIQPTQNVDEKNIGSNEDEYFAQFRTASSSARQFVSIDKAMSFLQPGNWVQSSVNPDVSDPDIGKIELSKVEEGRPHPIGRLTIEYSQKSKIGEPPTSVFETSKVSFHGIEYVVVSGEEDGGMIQNYFYNVYYGFDAEYNLFVRVFSYYESESEKKEHLQILSTIRSVSL